MGTLRNTIYNCQHARGVNKLLDKVIKGENELVTLANELRTDHATFRTIVNDNKTLANSIRTAMLGDYLCTKPGLTIASTNTNVKNVAFYYRINGQKYYKANVDSGTAPTGSSITANKYGAWAFDIGTNGTIDVVEASSIESGYSTASAARAAVPSVAADHVRMGYLTAKKAGAVFDPGTTALSSASVDEAYTSGSLENWSIGSAVATSVPAAVGASAVTLEITRGV